MNKPLIKTSYMYLHGSRMYYTCNCLEAFIHITRIITSSLVMFTQQGPHTPSFPTPLPAGCPRVSHSLCFVVANYSTSAFIPEC